MGIVKKKAAKKTSRDVTSDGHFYMTKRIVVGKAQAAGRQAAASAMQVMGFVVVVEDGNVIRKYANGNVEIIGPVTNEDQTQDIDLD